MSGVPYTGVQLELYEESMRLVPAIIKAKIEDRGNDAFELYKGLLEDGDERGLTREQTWATFSTAAVAWTTQLFAGASQRLGIDLTGLLDEAIHASAFWSASAG